MTTNSLASMFKKNRDAKPRPENRLVQIIAYNREAQVDGCYVGTFTGKMIDGPAAGKEITIALVENQVNAKTPKVADLSAPNSKKNLSSTQVGGIAQFDNLLDTGKGHYTATWAKKWADDLDPRLCRANVLTRVVPSTKYDPVSRGDIFLKHKTGDQRYRTEHLHVEAAVVTANLDEMKLAMAEAFQGVDNAMGVETNRAVVAVATVTDEAGNFSRSELIFWRNYDKETGTAHTVEEVVENSIARVGVDNLNGIFGMGGKIDVIPMSHLETGRKVSEMMDTAIASGKKAIVDITAFQFDPRDPSKGYGWSNANLLLKFHEDLDGNPGREMFTYKAVRSGALTPLSAINTPSDPQAASRFYAPANEERAAKRAAADAERIAAQGATAAAELPKSEASGDHSPVEQTPKVVEEKPAVENKAAALVSNAQPEDSAPDVIEGLDAILDDIAADEFGPS